MSGVAKAPARAVADLGAGTILATVEIAAAPERVFQALASDEIARWWGSPELYRTTAWVGDVRPGGRWRASGIGADGATFAVEGEFLEVEPPRRLVQTWRAPWDGGHETTITYRLDPIEGGTRVTLRHEGFAGRPESCRGHGDGWERVLGWLGKHLDPGPGLAGGPDARRYFVCRLIAPRATFMQDMSPEEGALMREHAGYWRDLLGRGVAVVFGPVADPKGGWGIGIVRTSTEDEMLALRDGDPVMRSGRGFQYEILPMVRAVVRD